jgi:hypothetical protein
MKSQQLDRTEFRRSNIADSPDPAVGLSIRQRMLHLLKRGAMTKEKIAEAIEELIGGVSGCPVRKKSVRLADEVSTERFCSSFLEMHNSMERNVIRRVITVDTNEIHSNVHNLAGDGLVINKSKIDFLPLECIQRGLKVLHGGDSTSHQARHPWSPTLATLKTTRPTSGLRQQSTLMALNAGTSLSDVI